MTSLGEVVASPQPGPGPVNAVARGLRVLGDEWAMLIVQRALLGDRRYGEFRSALPISDAVLTTRLGELVDLGLLRPAPSRSPLNALASRRIGYDLTAMGRSLWPVHVFIWDWERAWAGKQQLPTMRHRACGAEFVPLLACAHCDGAATADTITSEWGPEGGWHRSVPRGGRRRRGTARGPGQFPETMAVVGNHWSLAVLVAALWGTRRFGDFTETLGISPAVLSERLRDLVAGGLLQPRPSRARSDWLDYHPTPKALGLIPVFAVMVGWAERWFGDPDRPSVIPRHSSCGASLAPRVICNRCRAAVRGADIVVEGLRSPGLPAAVGDSHAASSPAYSVH